MKITKLERCPPMRFLEGEAISTRGRRYQFHVDHRRREPAGVFRYLGEGCWWRVKAPKQLTIAVGQALMERRQERLDRAGGLL